MICKICTNRSNLFITGRVLNKYDISYYQCSSCQFVQTEQPYWLEESYSKAISSLDVGLVARNIMLAERIIPIVRKHFSKGKYIDYGGGYGLFVRMMRDRGYDFHRYDIYCENIFSEYFDIGQNHTPVKDEFSVLTSFEVFEHLENPCSELESMLEYSSNILFTTELLPEKEINTIEDWWYFTPESGQHIAFYSLDTLNYIAKKYNKKLYTDGKTLHLFTDIVSRNNIIGNSVFNKIKAAYRTVKCKGLVSADYNYIKKQLNS